MIIDYQHVDIFQDEACIFDDISLQLEEGEYVYLIGKVGSGKTSLLKTMYAELDIDDGKAKVLGYNLCNLRRKHIPMLRREIGIVFQDFQLLTDRTVYENLAFVLRATKWNNNTLIEERIENVLNQVSMLHKRNKMPNELSGGEQQRIVIARAILNSPKLILADEPTGNLDPETGQEIIKLLRRISEKGTTVIITTHNLQTIDDFPGRVIMCDHQKIKDVTAYCQHRQQQPMHSYYPYQVTSSQPEIDTSSALIDRIREDQQEQKNITNDTY